MIYYVYLALGEGESVKLVSLVALNVLSLDLGGVVSEEAVSKFLADEPFLPAMLDQPTQKLFVEIDCGGRMLNHFVHFFFVIYL